MVCLKIERDTFASTNPNKATVTLTKKGRKAAVFATSSFPIILLLLNLWKVPIILLIVTTGVQPTHAVSIATVSISKPNDKGNLSDNYSTSQKLPNKLTYNSNEGSGEASSGGSLSLSFGGLVFNNNYQQQVPKDVDPSSIKKSELVKRSGPETRITSNQDVTTLALAVDNSSSVAIANINSSWNNVYVTIGTPTGNPFQYPPQSK